MRSQFNSALASLLDAEGRSVLYRVLVPLSFSRSLIDFGVPIAVAIGAVVMLTLNL